MDIKMFVSASFQENFGDRHPQDPVSNRHSLVSMIVYKLTVFLFEQSPLLPNLL
jgi:hypothetical protein